MTIVIGALLCIFTLSSVLAQRIDVSFNKKLDTLFIENKTGSAFELKVSLPPQAALGGHRVEVVVDEASTLPREDVFFSTGKDMIVSADKHQEESIKMFIKKPEEKDGFILFRIKGYDEKGAAAEVNASSSTYILYVKPKEEVIPADHEFWLLTGTNIDLLDGVRAKELYFKGSFLFPVNSPAAKSKKHGKGTPKKPQRWFYVTFGKNRYFSEKDSITRISFTDVVPNPSAGDSITIVNGFYNTLAETETNNIFASLDFLEPLNEDGNTKSRYFATIGMNFGLQSLRTKFKNNSIVADTNTFLRKNDSTYTFRPTSVERKTAQFNYNFSVGFMHILTTKDINVKTQFSTGVNILRYPSFSRTTGAGRSIFYEDSRNIYMQFRLDATVLAPGISLGFETFNRKGEPPLFNVSLTKVIDIKQLGTLFQKLTPVVAKN